MRAISVINPFHLVPTERRQPGGAELGPRAAAAALPHDGPARRARHALAGKVPSITMQMPSINRLN